MLGRAFLTGFFLLASPRVFAQTCQMSFEYLEQASFELNRAGAERNFETAKQYAHNARKALDLSAQAVWDCHFVPAHMALQKCKAI